MHYEAFSRYASRSFATLAVLLSLGCGSESTDVAVDGGSGADAGAAVDGGSGCVREAGPANASRFVVVSRPYGDAGVSASTWQVLELSVEGELTATDTSFTMGRATGGVVAFTPDGEIGIVPQEDGSLGIFRIDQSGAVSVLHEHFTGDFYAGSVVMGQQGDVAYVLSTNWRENGGGVFQLSIGCDGSVKDEGLLVAAKLPLGMLLLEAGGAVIAAQDLGNSALEQDVHLVASDMLAMPTASTTIFPDRDAIVGSIAITADEQYVLVGDNSGFSGVPNRVGVARVGANSLESVQLLTPLEDPYAMATSPFDDAAIVVSGFGNAIYQVSYNPESGDAPFVIAGELAYSGAPPQLPADVVQIQRGELLGLVLIAENQGIRRIRFEGGGVILDLGLSAFGESFAAIVGAVGVQP